ncbi:ABC1 kinase family protein [Megalodesulfovibrio paquesii]
MQFFQLRSVLAARRLKSLVTLFIKYGLGELASLLGHRYKIFPRREEEAGPVPHQTIWERLRNVMEDMGPTTIKIGQILSMRPDLVPAELCDTLRDLQEDVYHEEYTSIVKVVEDSLKLKLTDVFASFNVRPVAAASLSQVHKAVLKDGRVVAVKVRRPKIMETIVADLEILRFLAIRIHERAQSLRMYNLPEVVAEISKTLTREMDFRNEARNIILFNKMFEDDPQIMAPKIIPEWTTDAVLVMEFVEGVRIDEFEGDLETRRALAEKGLDAVVRQLMVHGFFHADPHMGNLKIVGKDTLCYMDWGMAGHFTRAQRSALVDYVLAIVENDAEKVARVVMTMAVKVPPLLDKERFQADIMFILDTVRAPLHGEVNLGRFLLELTGLSRNYGITVRPDYILMARALIATEAAGRALYPPFNAVQSLQPVALRWLVKRYTLLFSDKPVIEDIQTNLKTLLTLPSRLERLLSVVESGQLGMDVRVADHEDMMTNLRRVANRLAAALIAASLVIGSSLLFLSNIGPHWGELPVFGLIGFILSGLFSVWLVLHMVTKSG